MQHLRELQQQHQQQQQRLVCEPKAAHIEQQQAIGRKSLPHASSSIARALARKLNRLWSKHNYTTNQSSASQSTANAHTRVASGTASCVRKPFVHLKSGGQVATSARDKQQHRLKTFIDRNNNTQDNESLLVSDETDAEDSHLYTLTHTGGGGMALSGLDARKPKSAMQRHKHSAAALQICTQQQTQDATQSDAKHKPHKSSTTSPHRAGTRLAALGLFGLLGALALIAMCCSAQQQIAGNSVPQFGAPNSLAAAQRSQQGQSPVAPSVGSRAHSASPMQQQQQQAPLGSAQSVAGSLVAQINCNKIRGHVTLTPNAQGGTTVTTHISAGPPGEVYQWGVHQFPVKPGAAMCSCSPLVLGAKLIDLSEMHGNLPSEQEFSVQSSLNLFASDSPVGHSLMLRGIKTGMVACATFLPTSRKSNYRAKFHMPLSGSVTIFQTAFGTSFISHLMYSNGTRRHSMHRFDLVRSDDDIVATSLLNGAQVGSVPSAAALRASETLEHREHEHELTQCRRLSAGAEPLFRNLSYQLAVSTENFGMRGRTALVLPQVPFETFSSVYIVVYSEHDASEPIACAPLKFVRPKTAAAKFASGSVQGSVVFLQDSPYDVTIARVSLQMPNSDAHSYGIDELPMIIRRKSDTRVCPNIREIIYNPHHVEPSSVPPEGEATSDQYAVGDLSGKYGSLAGKQTEKIQVNDFNLPLFGPLSIVGRAMTIYSAEGVAIACSNVELTAPMTTAFATFDFGIQGQFIFRQPVNDCNGDTYVYIEVSKPLGSAATATSAATSQDQSRTVDHNWHIHANPVDSGLDHLSTSECAPAGSHYNPYNTSTATIYSRDCTPFNVLRCELGDLSAKMFTIDIPPYKVKGAQEPDIGKFFGTDIDLPLCGPVSIVNRSVVVHASDFSHHRLACSTVIEFKPRTS